MPPTALTRQHPLDTARLLMQLMRFDRPLCAAALTLLGAWLAAPPATSAMWSAPVLLAACVVGLITAFGFVINDCCDLAVDTLGKPGRPLPSGRISRATATRFAWALAGAGLLLALLLGRSATLFALGAIALSAAYSYRLKSTLLIGNATVAVLVAMVIVFGAVMAGGATPAAWLAAAMTLCYVTAQEVLFNLEDEAQDRAAGLRTTATRLGTAGTARLLRGLLLVFIAVALLPVVARVAHGAYLPTLVVLTLAPVLAMLLVLRAPLGAVAVARAARLSRLVWVTSFVPLALLR
jgi:geranylgeranylglycerol-phosphate geranylgeranyltransferase